MRVEQDKSPDNRHLMVGCLQDSFDSELYITKIKKLFT